MTDIEVETSRPAPKLDDGEHELFAHYVKGGNDAIMRAMVLGEPCTALCGKVWIPSRDPERFPVCPTCQEEKERNHL